MKDRTFVTSLPVSLVMTTASRSEITTGQSARHIASAKGSIQFPRWAAGECRTDHFYFMGTTGTADHHCTLSLHRIDVRLALPFDQKRQRWTKRGSDIEEAVILKRSGAENGLQDGAPL